MNIKAILSKPIIALAALATIGASAGIGALASADTATSSGTATATAQRMPSAASGDLKGMRHMGPGKGQGIMGTVSAINGNIITVTNQDGTSYAVDASNATVSKMVTESVSDIAVGDRIDANGTVSGTTVTANRIMAGIPPMQQRAAGTQAAQ